jgi:hypothetical protein
MRLLLSAFLFFAPSAVAQNVEKGDALPQRTVPVIELKMGDPVRLRLPSTGITLGLPIVCDSRGSIFVRLEGAGDHPFQIPVIRVDKDNNHVRYDLSKIDITGDIYTETFGVDGRGRLFAATRVVDEKGKKVETYITEYDSDGRFTSKAPYDNKESRAEHVFKLSSGDYLLQSRKYNQDNRVSLRLYSSSGEFKRELVSEEEVPKSVEMIPYKVMVTRDDKIFALSFLSGIELSEFSAAGELVRKTRLNAPFPPKAGLYGIVAVNDLSGRLLISFWRSLAPSESDKTGKWWTDHVVFDPQTGEAVAIYRQQDPGVFSCLQGENAVWLKANKEGYFEIRTARVQ